MSDLKQVSPQDQAKIEGLAEPVVEYLLSLKPSEALNVMVAASAVILLSLKYKEGKTALDNFDHNFAPSIRKTVEQGFTPLPDDPVMDVFKPHHGRIEKWHRVAFDGMTTPSLGYYIMGTLLDHPTIPVTHTNTSLVLKHDKATGEIETANSRYRLVGPEVHTP